MPGNTTKVKAVPIKDYELVIGGQQNKINWRAGVMTFVDESRLPFGAVVDAKNCMQTQDGVWSTRWGSRNYGASYTGPVTGFVDFIAYNADGSTTQYYMIIDNGALKYAKDGGAWTTITGHTFTTTKWTTMMQYGNKVLICNGYDPFSYVDITTFTWTGFTGLSTPGTVTGGLGAGLSAGVYNLYYQVTAVSKTGETPPSTVTTITTNIERSNWWNPNATQVASNTIYTTLSWTAISNAIGYNIYLSDGVSGVSYYLDSVTNAGGGTITYTDYGSTAINDFIQVPSTDTTVAPKFSWISLSDNRLWAIGDPNNPNRLYWAGTGGNNLAFNASLGGGWVDILPGGKQKPYYVGQFRDGKGDPMTTILLSEQTGYGTTWHCSITTSTIGNTVIAIPTLIQSLDGFGTTAPRSVVQTNQNAYFHSPGPAGVFSTGSVPTLFNILSTNEISYVIRPDMKSLTFASVGGICGIEFDRKLLYSVPYANSTNNRIMVYDLNKQNWNPYAFNFGVQHFIRYSDNSGVLHLLAIPTNPTAGNYIQEISQYFYGDNGVGFDSHIQTGMIHVTPDHIQFARVRYVYYEFGSPNGHIQMVFAGTTKNQPLTQLASYTTTTGDSASNVGFSSYAFSTEPFSFASAAPTATTQLSVKERIRINQFLNNYEAEVYSNSVSTYWTLNQIIVKGQLVPTADPSGWILN
jgi:hypothetical protein